MELLLQGHENFKKWAHSNFAYEYEGKDGLRQTRPLFREIRFYDCIIKRQAVQHFIDDMSIHSKDELLSGGKFDKILKLIRSLLPFDIPILPKKEDRKATNWNMHMMGGPLYIQFIGTMADMVNENGEDML